MAVTVITKNDVFRVTYFCTFNGQRIETVLHQRCDTAPLPATGLQQVQDLATTIADPTMNPFLNGYIAATTAAMSFDYVTVQKIKPVRDIYVKAPIGAVGTRAGTALVQNIAMSIEKQTTVSSRKGIGRMQLCGMAATDQVAGVFTGAYQTLISGTVAPFLQGIATPGQNYLGTYYNCLIGISPVVDDYDIYQATPMTTARTMHRRTVGLGI